MISQTVTPYPGPFSPGPAIYSIPARVYANGKTVAGYLTTADTDTGREYWLFNPYLYHKNWREVAPESYSGRDICLAERLYKASGEL